MFAGPSDVLVIADASADARHVALDLLSQAEHNPGCCILVTTDAALLKRIEKEIAALLSQLAQGEVVRDALERFSAMVLVRDLDEAARVANFLSPEHLQIVTAAPRELLPKIRAAGAVFLGGWTPVAVGDEEVITLNIQVGDSLYMDDKDTIIAVENWKSAMQRFVDYHRSRGLPVPDVTDFSH